MPVYTTRPVVTTSYSTRPVVTTSYSTRTGPQSDLGYFITQLGILNDNSGNRILFNTGIFYDSPTIYTTRIIPA